MRPMILVVDRASSDRTNWKSFLVNQGYEVFIAGDEDSAIRECHLLQPDLIILHDTLPEIDVLGLCRRLKESPRNELIPIVLIERLPNRGIFLSDGMRAPQRSGELAHRSRKD